MRTALSMYVGVFLMVTCGSLLGADLASATELAPTERTEMQQIASGAYPNSACHGNIRIAWQHDLQATVPELAARGLRILGFAYGVTDGTCNVGVRSDLDPVLACTVALHEAGHLAGLQHGSSVLMGDSTGDFGEYRDARCVTLTRLDRLDAIDAVWSRVSERARVRCQRVSPTEFKCVASHRRTRVFWQVRQIGDRTRARVVGAIA